MNVETITMPRKEARAKLIEYRDGLKRKSSVEYERAAVAFKQLAKGTPLLVLSQVIQNAPRDARQRPGLAIARADRWQVRYERHSYNSRELFRTSFNQRNGPIGHDTTIGVPLLSDVPRGMASVYGYSLVPLVPPKVQRGHALAQHFVLWEVKQWADREINAESDRDPYLLKRVSDDLFAVVGAWELTDVERAIMVGRR